jgi:aspartate dehydrogenase
VLKVGIVGAGTIGRTVAQAIDRGEVRAELVGICSRSAERAKGLAASLACRPPVLALDELIARADLVVEAAGGKATEAIAPRTLERGKDLMVLSGGALLGRDDWFALAEARGARILVPSGAIVGLDGVKAACLGPVRSVTIESRKPPAGLTGSPYVVEHAIDLDALTQETLIFEGSALDACKAFPANVNVSAALSLAGIGPQKTRVKVLCVPGGRFNMHDIVVEGEFGSLRTHVENVPTETNPRTGRLAAMSAVAMLKSLTATLRVGT